jgi:formate hydrogenlyase subunit 3/multisubunit Na+/H+ antiporter MnhD subunit
MVIASLALKDFQFNISESAERFLFSIILWVFILMFGLLIFFIPYAVETIVLLLWSRNKDDRRIRNAILLSPVITAIFCIAFVVIVGLVAGDIQGTVQQLVGPNNVIDTTTFILSSYFVVRYALIGMGFLLTAFYRKRKIKKQIN